MHSAVLMTGILSPYDLHHAEDITKIYINIYCILIHLKRNKTLYNKARILATPTIWQRTCGGVADARA